MIALYILGMNRSKNNFSMVSFSHYEVEPRTKKSVFYKNINAIIDWQKMEKEINKYYSKANNLKGEKPLFGVAIVQDAIDWGVEWIIV